ncbi:MAG: succinate dehydrogenase assembly factor 2 [Gammaproteobacteria bacterium]|nr:succinate dehydrogenase assembly factor 2 [Gammaproteobacteria bacterium]MYE30818.1 succinate dehydrogenase assembly factor 2 [Gammaproteobacteria bacterium]MYI02142.1 succinate dehydrogenase assembly factor 2 [Gammaproteobacteria bacterium]
MALDSRIPGDLQKIYWRSRRGMLELDLLLVPFTLEAYADLSPADQLRYRQLLECEDQDLFAWLIRREPAANRQALIDSILAHNSARSEKAD